MHDRPDDGGELRLVGGWRALQLCPRPVVLFLYGTFASDVGQGFFRLVLPWLVYNLKGTPEALGTLAAVQFLPGLLLPWLGAIVDRSDARRVIAGASLAQIAVTLATLSLFLSGHLGLWLIYASAMLATGLGMVAYNAQNVLLRRATPERARVSVNALSAIIFTVAWYVSPGLAGPTISDLGIAAALAINAASYVFVLVPALFLPHTAPDRSAATAGAVLRPAWAALRRAPSVLHVTLVFAFWNFTWGGVYALEVFFFRASLHWDASEVGLVGMAAGLVPVALGIVGPYLAERLRIDHLLVATLGLSGIGMVLLGFVHGVWPAVAAVGLLDGAVAPVSIVMATLSQRQIASAVYGRVSALQSLVVNLPLPAGGALAGVLAQSFGIPATFSLLGLCTLLSGGVVLRSGLRRLRLFG